MRIVFVLVHNKGNQGNIDQINTLSSLLTKVSYTEEIRDDNGNVIESIQVSYYEFNDSTTTHHAYVCQVVPYGVTLPTNLYDLESRVVFYGNNDQDKTGEHPRFLNWGLKKGAEHRTNAIIYIKNANQLTASSLDNELDLIDTALLSEISSSIIIAGSVYADFGLLNESLTFANAIIDLENRING